MDNNYRSLDFYHASGVGRMSEPPLPAPSQDRGQPIVGAAESRMSASAPERTIDSYKLQQVLSSKKTVGLSLPRHMETLAGQIAQLSRITGPNFLKIDSYSIYRGRIPVLENLFSAAAVGKLPSLQELLEDRKQHVSGLGQRFGDLVADPVFLYLHFLLFFHARGVPDIKSLAPYHEVKQSMIEYWCFLIRPESLGKKVQELCEPILGEPLLPENHEETIRLNPENEAGLLLSFYNCVEKVEERHWRENEAKFPKRSSSHLQIGSSLTNSNIVNLLLDFLSVSCGGKANRVMASWPKNVVRFLDCEFSKIRPDSNANLFKSRLA